MRRRRSSDSGAATAELAVAFPAVLLLIMLALTALTAVVTQLKCADAAREAARAAARGDSGVRAGQRAAPPGASVRVVPGAGGTVYAEVSARIRGFGPLLPRLTVSGSATALEEPGVTP